MDHSKIDTAASFKRNDFTLYAYIPNDFPINSGSEFWIIPKNKTDKFEFKTTNSILINSNSEIKACVIPQKENFNLIIIKNGKQIETISFRALELKPPTFSVYSKNLSFKDGFIDRFSDSIFVELEQPEIKYRRIYPKDCRYTVDSIVIKSFRADKEINTITIYNGGFNLSKLQVKHADKLVIQAYNIRRKNFINQSIKIMDEIREDFVVK